jgi:predicted nucleic acid-binding Zn ribbon protein
VSDTETWHDTGPGQGEGEVVPERLCPHCATISQTAGEFCPHCGKAFAKRQRFSKRVRVVIVAVLVVVLLGGAGAGFAIKRHHDEQVEAQHKAALVVARAKQLEKERTEAAELEAKANSAREATEAKASKEKQRKVSEAELEKGVEAYAKKLVSEGTLEEPVLGASCTPVSGGSSTELGPSSGTFSCIAITKYEAGGEESGTHFSATIDFARGTYSYRLGD